MVKDKVAVYVSKDLHDLVKHRVEKSDGDFKNVEDYVELVLREVVKEENGEEEKKTYTKEEEEQIKKRMKSLGYL